MAILNYNGVAMKTITKEELMEVLENLPEGARIVFTSDYGDYHHTDQALPLKGDVEEREIVKSAYSHSGFALLDVDQDEEDEDEMSRQDDESADEFAKRMDAMAEEKKDRTYFVIS